MDLINIVKRQSKLTLFCHQNADPDSACSAISLKLLLEKALANVQVTVSCPKGISAATKRLLRNLGLSLPTEKVPPEIGAAVLVDTNNLAQLGVSASKSILESDSPLLVVDHHHRHPDVEQVVKFALVVPDSSSTAELVTQLYRVGKVSMSTVVAEALLAAVFIETRYFVLANARTFAHAKYLVSQGADPRKIQGLLSVQTSPSERIARLKAAQRLRIESIGQWTLVVSQVGSYQSSAARGLLLLGADVSIVAGETRGVIRVNLRSSENFYKSTHVHLGRDVAIPVGKSLDGSGGGHPTAAGLQVGVSVEKALEESVEAVRRSLQSLKYERTVQPSLE